MLTPLEKSPTVHCDRLKGIDLFVNFHLIFVVVPTLTREAAVKNTISAFLCVSESIPEDPESISNILQHIATCNAQAVIGTPGGTTHWPDLFYPTTTHCVLCNQELSSPIHPTGSNRKSYLLTKVQLFPVTAKIRKCTNQDCMARYSYSTWREGNIIFFIVHVFVFCSTVACNHYTVACNY